MRMTSRSKNSVNIGQQGCAELQTPPLPHPKHVTRVSNASLPDALILSRQAANLCESNSNILVSRKAHDT